MDTKVIAFAGKLSSGKTTCANLIAALAFHHLIRDKDGNRLIDRCYVHPDGNELMVSVSEKEDKELNFHTQNPEAKAWLAENVWPYYKPFSCAGPLKEFCIKFFGLNPDHVYGSAQDKQNLTHLRLKDMPTWTEDNDYSINEYMTVREVLEYVGTEIIRKMYPDAHAEALVKDIELYNPVVATVDDVRFINEVKKLQAKGAKVGYLTRVTEEASKNNHKSNIELDNYDGFDFILQNNEQTRKQTLDNLIDYLIEIEWLPKAEEVTLSDAS